MLLSKWDVHKHAACLLVGALGDVHYAADQFQIRNHRMELVVAMKLSTDGGWLLYMQGRIDAARQEMWQTKARHREQAQVQAGELMEQRRQYVGALLKGRMLEQTREKN